MYDRKIFKSVRFDFPIIGVGNLSAGGTGKSPHIEYLLALTQYILKTATLSRGYGRRSHGFVIADYNTTALQVGDEPAMFKQKFPEAVVAVGEDRVLAVPKLLDAHPDVDVLFLDDAFQHRPIRAGLSILLTEYHNLFTRDNLLPVGWLREAKHNYHRADIIIVSKCPTDLTEAQRSAIISEIKPFSYQKVYFSTLQYGQIYAFSDHNYKLYLDKDMDVLLVSGIAKFGELKQYLESKARKVYLRDYNDHHRFDSFDLENIRDTFRNLGDVRKVIITTEKDATRLAEHRNWFSENKIEIFVQPVQVQFLGEDGAKFNSDIFRYIEVTRRNLYQTSEHEKPSTED